MHREQTFGGRVHRPAFCTSAQRNQVSSRCDGQCASATRVGKKLFYRFNVHLSGNRFEAGLNLETFHLSRRKNKKYMNQF